jgi:hypothetical protein
MLSTEMSGGKRKAWENGQGLKGSGSGMSKIYPVIRVRDWQNSRETCQVSQCPSEVSKGDPPEYNSTVLSLRLPARFVVRIGLCKQVYICNIWHCQFNDEASLVTCIRKASGSNFSQDSNYSAWFFVIFLSPSRLNPG